MTGADRRSPGAGSGPPFAPPRRFRRAFVLGKFAPPHAGHLHLIDSAARAADAVTVLVCTSEQEGIPGALRAEWMRVLRPALDVVHLDLDTLDPAGPIPRYPHERPDFWSVWTALLRRTLPRDTDAFFSSEAYGGEVAARLGLVHVEVDRARRTVPVSGTDVRAAPFAHWERIPDPVRPWFVRRIAVMGPESTGKSVLAERLAAQYDTVHVAEYGREHTERMDMSRFALADIEAIAAEHARRTEAAARRANRLLICDTEAITTAVWSEIYFGACPASVAAAADAQACALHLLCAADVPWVDDGTRTFPHLREWHFARLSGELDRRGLPWVVLSGSWEERWRAAVAAVDGVVREGMGPVRIKVGRER